MKRTEQLQGLLLMKLEEVYDRTASGVLSVWNVGTEFPALAGSFRGGGRGSYGVTH